MADFHHRHLDNLPGRYYVDDQCLDCDLCREVAPMVFQRNDPEGYSFVARQPETSEEHLLCEEAVGGCPHEAIGNDGDVQAWSIPPSERGPQTGRLCPRCHPIRSFGQKILHLFKRQ